MKISSVRVNYYSAFECIQKYRGCHIHAISEEITLYLAIRPVSKGATSIYSLELGSDSVIPMSASMSQTPPWEHLIKVA